MVLSFYFEKLGLCSIISLSSQRSLYHIYKPGDASMKKLFTLLSVLCVLAAFSPVAKAGDKQFDIGGMAGIAIPTNALGMKFSFGANATYHMDAWSFGLMASTASGLDATVITNTIQLLAADIRY